ncbi:hypothetical protein [Rhodobacter sp. SY28-1]|uniref:hypothetical protein n=1 Tax=Rhodobacter sp. SY28-1 TaxID=2562317 RepID=UPI0010C006BA|nr:hypothetical protein [Rhodobacter sp. SY28-1]
MKQTTILVPASIATVLFSAMVFASTPTANPEAVPAKAPNRAELFAIDTCGAGSDVATVQATSWQNALGGKRVMDRALVLAKDGAAQPCDVTSK